MSILSAGLLLCERVTHAMRTMGQQESVRGLLTAFEEGVQMESKSRCASRSSAGSPAFDQSKLRGKLDQQKDIVKEKEKTPTIPDRG